MVIGARILRTIGSRTGRIALTAATILSLAAPAGAGSALSGFSDQDLAHGFFSTVFGLEHGGGASARMVKKFNGPVRFQIVDGASRSRERDIRNFVRGLPRMVRGLDARMASTNETPNFLVYVVDRKSYVTQARASAFDNPFADVPGRCMVKVEFGGKGIKRAAAVIVSDDGEQLFKRCMVEEILQGLGPMNDDRSLGASVFNDYTDHARFMPFDRAIVSMLYDPRLKHGMSKTEAAAVLPEVLATVRRQVR